MRLDTALELSLYLSRETENMAVTQGFGELVPLYKLMEKRDMTVVENQMKVRTGRVQCSMYSMTHFTVEEGMVFFRALRLSFAPVDLNLTHFKQFKRATFIGNKIERLGSFFNSVLLKLTCVLL